jgi:hypothetical protein
MHLLEILLDSAHLHATRVAISMHSKAFLQQAARASLHATPSEVTQRSLSEQSANTLEHLCEVVLRHEGGHDLNLNLNLNHVTFAK